MGLEQLPEGAVQIGPNEWYTKVYHDDVWVGINEWHYNDKDNLCGGWVPFEFYNPRYGWKVEQGEPLTLSPSLLCNVCKHHGFIREGKWVGC